MRFLPLLSLLLPTLWGCGRYEPTYAEAFVLPHVKDCSRGGDRVLVIPLHGVITEEAGGLLGGHRESPVERVVRDLRRAVETPNVKAVILRVDTPGGGVTASDFLRREVETFRATGRPVIVYAEDLNASGGYYVSSAADVIVQNPNGITGSIGVISLFLNIEGLMQKIGVAEMTFKSGAHKDMTGLFRKMDDDERGILQGIVDELFGRFVDVVDRGRPALNRDQVKALADGRVYTASQALKIGLVDQVGYLEDAIEAAKRKAGLTGPVRVVSYEKVHEGIVVEFLNVKGGEGHPQSGLQMTLEAGDLLSVGTPRFYYLWMP